MNQIKEVKMTSSQSINLRYFDMTVEVDGISTKIQVTTTDIEKWLSSGEVDTAVVETNGVALGAVHKSHIFVAIDSNGDGKIDKEDLSWKILEAVRAHFFGEGK